MGNSKIRSIVSSRNALLIAAAGTALIAAACGSAGNSERPTEANPTPPANLGLDIGSFEELNPRPELRSIDRSIDLGFDERETLPRDAINPVYSPKFVTPGEVKERMVQDELVMGLSINGDARAYPVGIMRFREMVNDEVGGIPLLVTW